MPGKRKKPKTSDPRRLKFDVAPISDRLRYLCEFLFAGDPYSMARELSVCHRHFYTIYDGRCKLSIRMAGQIISTLGVRAEWLLNGTGPMFATDISETRFFLAPTIRSSFPLKPVGKCARPPVFAAALAHESLVPAQYAAAAAMLFRARVKNAPTLLLVGSAPSAVGAELAAFIRGGYVGSVCFTLQAAKQDATHALLSGEFDLNNVARFAATVGRGYGEAIASKIHSPRSAWPRSHSALAAAYDQSLPVAIQVELGEITEHFGAAYAGAELGAAIGAAAYVDQLVLADCLQKIDCRDEAVIVCAGEASRWLAMLERHGLARMQVVLAAASVAEQQSFTQKAKRVVCVDNTAPVFFRELLVAVQAAEAAGEMIGE